MQMPTCLQCAASRAGEIVRYERNGYGTVFVFQDANWNVTGTVNFAGDVLDRVHTKPYGEMILDAETVNGDYDGDGNVRLFDHARFAACELGLADLSN